MILYYGIPIGNTEPYVDDDETIAARWFSREELEELNIEISEKEINEAIKKAREQRNKEIKSIKEK